MVSGTIVDTTSIAHELARQANLVKSGVRARVEEVFGMVKRQRGSGRESHGGFAESGTLAFVVLALTQILLVRNRFAE